MNGSSEFFVNVGNRVHREHRGPLVDCTEDQ
jgi:hypothetical protein